MKAMATKWYKQEKFKKEDIGITILGLFLNDDVKLLNMTTNVACIV